MGHLQQGINAADRQVQLIGDVLGGRVAAQFLGELFLGAPELVHDFDHVHRNADGAGLVGNGARQVLRNPPNCVGGEFITATVLKLFDALHEADVAFLNQIEEGLAAVGVFFGDGNNQAKV